MTNTEIKLGAKSKITTEELNQIIHLLKTTCLPQHVIADEFGITQPRVCQLKKQYIKEVS